MAIDALAVRVLPENERGIANGFMFGASYLGQAVGGSGALLLIATRDGQQTDCGKNESCRCHEISAPKRSASAPFLGWNTDSYSFPVSTSS